MSAGREEVCSAVVREDLGVFFFFLKRMDVCIGGLLLETRAVCYSLMHQHSTHLDPNPRGNSKTQNAPHGEEYTHTHTHMLGLDESSLSLYIFS